MNGDFVLSGIVVICAFFPWFSWCVALMRNAEPLKIVLMPLPESKSVSHRLVNEWKFILEEVG